MQISSTRRWLSQFGFVGHGPKEFVLAIGVHFLLLRNCGKGSGFLTFNETDVSACVGGTRDRFLQMGVYWKEPFFPLPLPKIAPTSLEKRFVRE